jgi:hypothetical protein
MPFLRELSVELLPQQQLAFAYMIKVQYKKVE